MAASTDTIDRQSRELIDRSAAVGLPANPNVGVPAIDVVGDTKYVWSLNQSEEARGLCPRIRINLLQMEVGQIKALLNQGIQLVTDPYKGMFTVEPVKYLELPFFSNKHHDITNSWKLLDIVEKAQSIIQSVGTTGGKASQAALGALQGAGGIGRGFFFPSSKLEGPHVWSETSNEGISFSFNLYNTDIETYKTHKNFVNEMIFQSLAEKRKATFFIPPVLCEYEIPGVRLGPIAAFNFKVGTKGQSTFDGRNIPDAYECTFELQDLVMQTRNINPKTGPGKLGTVKVY